MTRMFETMMPLPHDADDHEVAATVQRMMSAPAGPDVYAEVIRGAAPRATEPWLYYFAVCPGDATRYDMVVGYEPSRHDAPWLVGCSNLSGRFTWINMFDGADGKPEAPNPGYVLGAIDDRRAPSGPGWRVAYGVAARILVARAIMVAP